MVAAFSILVVVGCEGAGYYKSRIVEVDPNGSIVWEVGGLWDLEEADRLPNGDTMAVWFNTVLSTAVSSRSGILELNSSGNVVREIKATDLYLQDAEYLENGNVLVCGYNYGGRFVREYDWNGTVVADVSTGGGTYWGAYDVERLPNGNTLVANGDKAIEFDKNWTAIWDSGPDISGIRDVERLSNGNTLMVSLDLHDSYRVIEMAPNGTIVWQFQEKDYWYPQDAERLPNGDTLIADARYHVIQVSREGVVVRVVKDVRLFRDRPVDVDWLPNGNILVTITDMPESVTWSAIGILFIFLLGPVSAEEFQLGRLLFRR